MAQVALYIGIKNGKRTLITEGDPREIRRRFKTSDGEGFDALEVFESTVGRSRKKAFKLNAEEIQIVEPQPETTPEPTDETVDIESLKILASGDKRKSETREAIEKLAALGIG